MCFPRLPFPLIPQSHQTMSPSFRGLYPLTRTLQLCFKKRPAEGSFSQTSQQRQLPFGGGLGGVSFYLCTRFSPDLGVMSGELPKQGQVVMWSLLGECLGFPPLMAHDLQGVS